MYTYTYIYILIHIHMCVCNCSIHVEELDHLGSLGGNQKNTHCDADLRKGLMVTAMRSQEWMQLVSKRVVLSTKEVRIPLGIHIHEERPWLQVYEVPNWFVHIQHISYSRQMISSAKSCSQQKFAQNEVLDFPWFKRTVSTLMFDMNIYKATGCKTCPCPCHVIPSWFSLLRWSSQPVVNFLPDRRDESEKICRVFHFSTCDSICFFIMTNMWPGIIGFRYPTYQTIWRDHLWPSLRSQVTSDPADE